MSSLQRLVGTVLGGYRLEKPIGEGGMGAIFEATQLSLSRRVAIKVLKPAFEQDEDRIKRFEVETEAIARLQHPHIVHVLDAGRTDDGTVYLAMELLEGKTVRQALRGGAIPWPRALTIAEGVASALVAAHDAGVIHRDLKAENVILWDKAGKPDFVKVLDFGVAKVTSQVQAPQITGTGFVAGTPGCMSPEQIVGKGDDPRSDLYSLGVLLFEMLTGRAPFIAQNPMELMLKHLNDPAPRAGEFLAQQGTDLPSAVDALVAGLLQKDASLRPPNAQALVDALRALRESTASTVPDLRSPVSSQPSGPSFTPADALPIGSKVIALPPLGTPARGANAAPMPSEAAPTSPPTSPTVTGPGPLASPDAARTRVRRAAVGGVLFVLVIAALFGVRSRMNYNASVPSTQRVAAEHIAKAEEAFWLLDVRRVLDEADLALAQDPDAAWAHVLKAQVTLLTYGPLAEADEHMAEAVRIADERARRAMMRETSHLQHVVGTLATLDTNEAIARFQAHPDEFSCDNALERLFFAIKMLTANQAPDAVTKLFEGVDRDFNAEIEPAVALGLARVARFGANFDEARGLLEKQLARTKSALIVEELADVEISTGNRARAAELLEGALKRNHTEARVRWRLAMLSRAKDAYEPLIADARGLPKTDLRRIDSLLHVGEQLAALGRMREADELWREAFDGATAGLNPNIATEVASIVMFFAILNDDYVRGRAWYERVKEWAPRCTNEVTAGRTKMFSLAAGFLLSRKDAQTSEVDFQILQRAKRDIPLVMQQITFSRAYWSGQFDEALTATERMPECFRTTYRGMVHRRRAEQMTDVPGGADVHVARREALSAAAAALDESTDPARMARCTAGASVLPWLQSITIGLAHAQRGLVARALEDRDGAQMALDGFRAHWPHVDPESDNARQMAEVAAWLATPVRP